MDNTRKGLLQLVWSHPNYDKCAADPLFGGFKEEHVTAMDAHVTLAAAAGAGTYSEGTTVTTDDRHYGGVHERLTKRPKLISGLPATAAGDVLLRYDADQFGIHLGIGTTPFAEATGIGTTNLRSLGPSTDLGINVPQLEDSTVGQGALKFAEEVNFPSLLQQTLPSMRGAQLTLKKIEVQFSKEFHNMEWIDVDFGSILESSGEAITQSLHDGSRTNVIRIYSDGKSKREEHMFDCAIGTVADTNVTFGIRNIGYTPRLGMTWAGLQPGCDVARCRAGIERESQQVQSNVVVPEHTITTNTSATATLPTYTTTSNHFAGLSRTTDGGTTNGHLLRVNCILERISD
tara:strand:+ start:1785 stop:2822 length:1038 start_codon:yes stop_codon:yes gene_type:complete